MATEVATGVATEVAMAVAMVGMVAVRIRAKSCLYPFLHLGIPARADATLGTNAARTTASVAYLIRAAAHPPQLRAF